MNLITEMKSPLKGTPHLCQPDGQKGCALCCGLFNLADIGKKNLAAFLRKGKTRSLKSALGGAYWTGRKGPDLRDRETYLCPFQGFACKNRPGCMVHPAVSGSEGRNRSLYGLELCRDYLCPAYSLLDNDLKHFMVLYIDDWYLYSTAIADPLSFRWLADLLMGTIGRVERVKENEALIKKALSAALTIHAAYLAARETPVFYHGVSEYLLNRDDFSLDKPGQADHAENIKRALDRLLL